MQKSYESGLATQLVAGGGAWTHPVLQCAHEHTGAVDLSVSSRVWHRTLSRRSQNGRVLWDRMRRLINRWLPLPTICHPDPLRRMGVVT